MARLNERDSKLDVAYSCWADKGASRRAALASSLRQLKLAAGAHVCVIDGYVPAVSLPRLDPQTLVIQLWHAPGAVKRFGWQSVGTPAGRSRAQAHGLRMHANYSVVVAGGRGAQAPYAEAFCCDPSVIRPWGLPRMDYLLDDAFAPERQRVHERLAPQVKRRDGQGATVLYVPTFRAGPDGASRVAAWADALAAALYDVGCQLLFTPHGLSASGPQASAAPPGQPASAASPAQQASAAPQALAASAAPQASATSAASAASATSAATRYQQVHGAASLDLLGFADVVVTDYSAVAFEAGLLHKEVVFYVPDIEEYRVAPGLNIDPVREFPSIAFSDAQAVAYYLQEGRSARRYESSGFWDFCDRYLEREPGSAIEHIVSSIERHLEACSLP
jgi:CDP-ribitol ribitolphosphotransferase